MCCIDRLKSQTKAAVQQATLYLLKLTDEEPAMWSLDSIRKVGELVAVVISLKMHILYLFMGP